MSLTLYVSLCLSVHTNQPANQPLDIADEEGGGVADLGDLPLLAKSSRPLSSRAICWLHYG